MRFAAVLLDVDGTLVSCGGAGRRSLERALADAAGPFGAALATLRLDGMTDRLIVREALALLGRPFDETGCDALLGRYVEYLRAEIHGPGYAVLPGVEPLLGRLRAAGATYGLCTGNVLDGARVKLARGGVDGWFEWHAEAVNGFASDGEARERIVAAAVRRAAVRLGRAVAPREVLVVGDTPRDVAAAHLVGCPVLAVATGRYRAEELAACGADHVVETLEDLAVPALLGG